jgi:hypothetical protein
MIYRYKEPGLRRLAEKSTPKSAPFILGFSAISVHTRNNSPDKPARLLTRKGLADRWQMSTETLKRRERAGVLRVLKLGRGVRYRLSDVEALEAAAEVR